MHLSVVDLSHKTALLDIRERLASPRDTGHALPTPRAGRWQPPAGHLTKPDE